MIERAITIIQPSAALLDPHIWTDRVDALNVRSAVYEPLVWMRPDATPAPALAESWETRDGRTWTFALRRRVVFHDGSVLSARQVVAALDRARSPAMAGELGTSGLYATYLRDATIDALGTDRLVVALPAPMADLLDLLADIPITGHGSVGSGMPTGTGPYAITDVTPHHLLMQAHPDHWAGPPPYHQLRWLADGDEERRVAAVAAGDADVVTGLTEPGRRDLQRQGRAVMTHEVPTTECVVLVCNIISGVCMDRKVRQALNWGLDVPAIISAAKHGAARPLAGPLTELHLGHDPEVRPYGYDSEAAVSVLRTAGFGNGLEVTLDFPTTSPDESTVLAEIVVEQYRRIGIAATVRMFSDRGEYAEVVKSKRIHDLACFDSTPASTYRVLREKFHGRVAGPWWQGYSNAAVDRAIDEAAATPDIVRRRALYREAFRRIRDDAAWVFLYSPLAIIGLGPRAAWLPVAPPGLLRFGQSPMW